MRIIFSSEKDAIKLKIKTPTDGNSMYFPLAKKENYLGEYRVYVENSLILPGNEIVVNDQKTTDEFIKALKAENNEQQ